MGLPALATPTELGVWINQTIPADDARAQALLDGASAEVRAAAGLTWVTEAIPPALADVPQVAKNVTLDAAARPWINPTGATTQTTGPFAATFGAIGVALTPDERARVSALNTDTTVSGIGTISTTRGPLETGRVIPYFDIPDVDGFTGVTAADDPFSEWGTPE